MIHAAPLGSGPLTRQVIEDLYAEALVLADEARVVFEAAAPNSLKQATQPASIALSVEGLRTTTRIMHILAWLLNQRAFMAGELNERQLQQHGALPRDRASEPDQLALLAARTRQLIAESERLHARVARLDEQQRQEATAGTQPVRQLHKKLLSAFG